MRAGNGVLAGNGVRRAVVFTEPALAAAGGAPAVRRLCAERALDAEFELRAGGDRGGLDLHASWLIDRRDGGFAAALGAGRQTADGFHAAVRASAAAALDHVRAVWDRRPTFSSYRAASAAVERLRRRGRLVFTNGVFDLLHLGHLRSLEYARGLGAALVVGVNGDASARALRPAGRPVIGQFARAELLAALRCVDAVIIFDEPDPLRLIRAVRPDVLVKGGAYAPEQVIGSAAVRAAGGVVALSPVLAGASTSAIVRRIIQGAAGTRRSPDRPRSTPSPRPPPAPAGTSSGAPGPSSSA